jgi:hypothetical protein
MPLAPPFKPRQLVPESIPPNRRLKRLKACEHRRLPELDGGSSA